MDSAEALLCPVLYKATALYCTVQKHCTDQVLLRKHAPPSVDKYCCLLCGGRHTSMPHLTRPIASHVYRSRLGRRYALFKQYILSIASTLVHVMQLT